MLLNSYFFPLIWLDYLYLDLYLMSFLIKKNSLDFYFKSSCSDRSCFVYSMQIIVFQFWYASYFKLEIEIRFVEMVTYRPILCLHRTKRFKCNDHRFVGGNRNNYFVYELSLCAKDISYTIMVLWDVLINKPETKHLKFLYKKKDRWNGQKAKAK